LCRPGPNKSGHKRVPRPIICQNFVFDLTGLKNTKLTTSGTSMPVRALVKLDEREKGASLNVAWNLNRQMAS
jgi:hypothetical protein